MPVLLILQSEHIMKPPPTDPHFPTLLSLVPKSNTTICLYAYFVSYATVY